MKDHAAFASDLHFGLTKREYFAGLAMQGIFSNETLCKVLADNNIDNVAQAFALFAIDHADALIAELEKMYE